MLDPGTIFDTNEEAFSLEAGTPKSAERFHREHIAPVFEADYEVGTELECAYNKAVDDWQRDGFIVGFRAAVQLLVCCMPGGRNSLVYGRRLLASRQRQYDYQRGTQ
jgi:hypothetical protein